MNNKNGPKNASTSRAAIPSDLSEEGGFKHCVVFCISSCNHLSNKPDSLILRILNRAEQKFYYKV